MADDPYLHYKKHTYTSYTSTTNYFNAQHFCGNKLSKRIDPIFSADKTYTLCISKPQVVGSAKTNINLIVIMVDVLCVIGKSFVYEYVSLNMQAKYNTTS